MPYGRNLSVGLGMIGDTFETSITWDRFEDFYETVRERAARAISEISGRPAGVSCRFTHVYPDGPAPYFSYSTVGTAEGKLEDSLARWRDIKAATNEICVSLGEPSPITMRLDATTGPATRSNSAALPRRAHRREDRTRPGRRDEPRRPHRPRRQGGGSKGRARRGLIGRSSGLCAGAGRR